MLHTRISPKIRVLRGRRLAWVAVLALSIVPLHLSSASDVDQTGEQTGEQIYQANCAHCHGPHGEGTEEFEQTLEGSFSIAQLAKLVDETMPEDDPGTLSHDEVEAVSTYLYDAFYSAVARERNRPARIELARLSVRQYRQAVSDVIGSFRKTGTWGDARGLTAEYYGGRRIGRRGKGVAIRTDAQIDLDFGTDAPVEEIAEPHEFSIRWTGSILAPATGDYQFVVRTEHAARLWVNDSKQPLIDAWVKSGDGTAHEANLFLTGGRVYPVRLEFTKAKQGVDDSAKLKEKPPSAKASIALLWKRPRGVLEPIPPRNLSPERAAVEFVCATSFPPDDRSFGWERGTSVSKAWDQATTHAAIRAAGYVALHLNELAGIQGDAPNRIEKLKTFCRSFAEGAFRRPLSDRQAEMFVVRQFAEAGDPEIAVKRVVLLVLKSPRFLFREVGDDPGQYDTAARLSFGLWNSIPDSGLRTASANGHLATDEQIANQARRMLSDPRARQKLRGFLLTWLRADSERDLRKDAERFPGYDAATIADVRTSLELFLDEVVWSDASDFRQLLLSEELYLNDRMAKFFGTERPSGSEFTKVGLESDKRAGVLTHPFVMASFAHTRESSPIHRGVFLARGLLGQSLRPPPEAAAPLAPDLRPDLTTRERVSLQTKAAKCMTCHQIINPLGFTLEHFDAAGRYRESDRGKPIDATGEYQTRGGKAVVLNGARELAQFLAESEETHAAFVEQLFHHLVGQPVRAYGPETLDNLRKSFAANNFNIRQLAIDIMVASARVGRDPEDTETATRVSQSP